MKHHPLMWLFITMSLWLPELSHSAATGQQFFKPLLPPRNAAPGGAITRVRLEGNPREIGLVLIKAGLDERQPLIFLVDTGFGGVVALDREVAQRRGLLEGVKTKPYMGFEAVDFKSLTIGKFTIEMSQAPVILVNLGELRELGGVEVSGIIGFGLLRLYVTRIDYVQGRFTLQFGPWTKSDEMRVLIRDTNGKLMEIIVYPKNWTGD